MPAALACTVNVVDAPVFQYPATKPRPVLPVWSLWTIAPPDSAASSASRRFVVGGAGGVLGVPSTTTVRATPAATLTAT